MKKKYYDAPQMEIVKLQHGMNLLDGSPQTETLGQGQGSIGAGNSDASMWFDNGDSGEDW